MRQIISTVRNTLLSSLSDAKEPFTNRLANTALKKKHSKTADDAKYQGTIIGRGLDGGEVQVEGGPETSIHEWIAKRSGAPRRDDDEDDEEARRLREMDASSPASSGLSSVGSRLGDDEEMDLS